LKDICSAEETSGRKWMKYRFSRIPELEYTLILGRSFCQEVLVTEEEMRCELLTKTKFQNEFKNNATEACHEPKNLVQVFEELLTRRDDVLKKIAQYAPEIYPFVDEEETEGSNGAKDESIDQEAETEDIAKEVPLSDLAEEAHEGDTCISVIANNRKAFEEPIQDYLKKYIEICDLFVKSSIKNREYALESISQLANLDIIAVKRQDLIGSILVALNISPQRMALALNSKAVLYPKRSDIYFIPPVVGRRLDGRDVVFHAYRSVDDYPILFPGINMEEKEIGPDRESRFRQEIADATKILYRLKKGRRGVRFPLSELSKIVDVYLTAFPVAKDRLVIVDLGTGRGGLLKGVVNRFLDESASKLLDDRSTWTVMLNDAYEEERTGEEFVRYATSDRASQFVKEIRKILGDLGKVVKSLGPSSADICFVNRVLDMYAKYGFYAVNLEGNQEISVSAAVDQKEDAELRGTVLTYKDLICFKDIYNLQRQLLKFEELKKRDVLPGVSYNLQNDFFKPRESSLEELLNMSRLVVISAFPATKATLFANLLKEKTPICSIGENHLSTEPRYVVFCLSKEKKLVDAICKNIDGAKGD
jgi:hypothetical protein